MVSLQLLITANFFASEVSLKKVLAETKVYIAFLLLALITVIFALALGSRPVSSDHTPVRVVVAKGSSAGKIADILNSQGLIRSPFVFKLTCKFSGSVDKLKPGVYEFDKSMSVPVIIDRLVQGKTLEAWLTIPEGYTARQVADLLKEKDLADDEVFTRLAITDGYRFPGYAFIYGHSIEGYLFPDTYLMSREMNAEALIKKMLDTFQERVALPFDSELRQVSERRFGLSGDDYPEGLHRILTVASLIEREAKVPRDRPLVAAVLWNRLAKKMRLEVDATVSYVPGQSRGNKDRVLYCDLKADSPYNTYRNAGLPPGPICNPGLAAIEAAIHPAKVDYLFYVAKPDGSSKFSRTYDEHLKAKKAIENGSNQ